MNGPQFAYQFLVGGAFFAVTLWAATRPSHGSRLSPSDLITVKVVVGGMVALVAANALWILAAGA